MQEAIITALGTYLPAGILTNSDLEKKVSTSDEWIVTRTGISERRLATAEETASSMGVKAALAALSQACLKPSDIDYLLVATSTPDYLVLSTAALMAGKLKICCPAVDLQAACSGFLYGLAMGKALLLSGQAKRVLFVATEKMSAFVDYTDRNTCVLFGDGASAAILSEGGEGLKIQEIELHTDGSLVDLLFVPAGGSARPATLESVNGRAHFLKMKGREIYKRSIPRMTEAIQACLHRAGLTPENIRWLIFHQANGRIMDATAESCGINLEKIYKTVHKYGNTSAASIGITLEELLREVGVAAQEELLLASVGAGLNWGAIRLTKV